MSRLNVLDRSTQMGFHNFHRKCQKKNILYASPPKLLNTRGSQQQQLIQHQHLDRGKTFIGSLRQNAHLIRMRISIPRRFHMRMVRCQTLRIYCTQESLHQRISSIPGDRHQATTHPHASNRSRRRIHQPPDASSPERTSNEPCRLCQRRTLFSRGS